MLHGGRLHRGPHKPFSSRIQLSLLPCWPGTNHRTVKIGGWALARDNTVLKRLVQRVFPCPYLNWLTCGGTPATGSHQMLSLMNLWYGVIIIKLSPWKPSIMLPYVIGFISYNIAALIQLYSDAPSHIMVHNAYKISSASLPYKYILISTLSIFLMSNCRIKHHQ